MFDQVTVIAPDRNRSGIGQGLTLEEPLRRRARGPDRYSVSGTPTDCVIVAMGTVFKDSPPDFVLSGINRGPNLGRDVFYSGTVAAAREGLFHKIPSVALSLVGRNTFPFERSEPAIEHVLKGIVARPWDGDYLLNVNIPAVDESDGEPGLCGIRGLRGVRVTDLGERFYNNELVIRHDPRQGEYIWLGGEWPTMVDRTGTDCSAVTDGYISITPVGVELTHRGALDAWANLEEDT